MAVLLLITEQEVKNLTSMPSNADASKFRHYMQAAQDEYIKPAIGETCYDLLLDAVENDNLTALETTLLDGDDRSFPGAKVALAWWILWLAYPDMWIEMSGSTISKKTGDNFESVSAAEFAIKRKSAEDQASRYTNYLIAYIKDNLDDYTCYSCAGLTPLLEDTTMSGIALDNDQFTAISEEQEIINREQGSRKTWIIP